MRKLASVRRIDAVKPIPDAEKICAYMVGGWWVVDVAGKYAADDMVIFCEVDSWIPTELAPFLSKGKEPREFEGVKGERLKTIRLRGQLSQGLLLPLSILPDNLKQHPGFWDVANGYDVTEVLDIKKWEAVLPAQLAGEAKGLFPSLIPKTDQERCQNLVAEIAAAQEAGATFEVTEKLEGSSMTVYLIDGEFGVCSRNLDLRETAGNAFWATARAEDIEAKMRACHGDFAIQGELIGPGIQGNIYKLSKPEFHVFDVYNVAQGRYLNPAERRHLIDRMGLKHAPVINTEHDLAGASVEQLLERAEHVSLLNPAQQREGIVFKQVNGGMSFKAISNAYLLGEK